jgi:serine/threonine protein kinase
MTDRLVAVKTPFLGSASESPRQLARHNQECMALAILTLEPDPALPTLYDAGYSLLGEHFYAREFVDGCALEQLVAAGALRVREGIRIVSTIALAVQRMHARQIAHRNLRPSGILVRADGTPKLIGFGHVWPLAGADRLPPGMSGVSAEVDVMALQEVLAWLCATLRQPVPAPLEEVRQPGSVPSPGRFAEALSCYLDAG